MGLGVTSGDEPVDLLSSSAYEDEGPVVVLQATSIPGVAKRDRTISGSKKELDIATKRFIKGVNLSHPTRAVNGNTAMIMQT